MIFEAQKGSRCLTVSEVRVVSTCSFGSINHPSWPDSSLSLKLGQKHTRNLSELLFEFKIYALFWGSRLLWYSWYLYICLWCPKWTLQICRFVRFLSFLLWRSHSNNRQWGTTKTPIHLVSTPFKFGGYSLPTKSWAPATTCWFRKTHRCRITWPSCWTKNDWNASVKLKPCPLPAAKWDVSCCVWLQKRKMHQGRQWCWPLHIWKAPRIWDQGARVFCDEKSQFMFDFQVHPALCFFETALHWLVTIHINWYYSAFNTGTRMLSFFFLGHMLNSQTCSRTTQRKGNVNSYSPCATCGGSWQEERWLLPCWVATWISAMRRQRKHKKTGQRGGNGVGPCWIKVEGFLKHPKYKINLESNSTTRRSIDIIVIQVNQTSWNTYLKVTYR